MSSIEQRDYSPSKEIAASEGDIWIELDVQDWQEDSDPDEVLGAIDSFVEENSLGECSGTSSGSGAVDISFEVANRLEAATQVRKFLASQFSTVKFCVSDEYEAQFHDEDYEATLREQVENLAGLAESLARGLAHIAEEISVLEQRLEEQEPNK